MRTRSVLIVGAGIGGLSAAIDLAARGCAVTVLERASTVGGKMRTVEIDGQPIDSGPTVLTMRWVFDALFAAAGLDFAAAVPLDAAGILARHAWDESARLDLHANLGRSADAIADFAGAAEAQRFIAFSERARAIYRTLEGPFIRSACSGPMALSRAVGLHRLRELWQIAPFTTLWRALGDHFHDPRLRQLFGRYATYCGSSPFRSPATLMLVAHVEQDGVWRVRGGMHRLAQAMAAAATNLGAQIRQDCEVGEILDDGQRAIGVRLASGECLYADAVIANADPSAIAAGLFGEPARRAVRPLKPAARSLSAVTWSMLAHSSGFPLSRHNVFFSGDYRAEFDDLRRARLPREPTVYVCAQDRGDGLDEASSAPHHERLLCLVNAPAIGDRHPFDESDIASCTSATFKRLQACGLSLQQQEQTPEKTVVTTPQDFHRLFPGTGGALYGPASHGWMASFQRPGSRSRMPGLYLAGGSTHPGPGVPMAAISGRLAAASLMADFALTQPWFPVAIAGGISMDSATTANTP